MRHVVAMLVVGGILAIPASAGAQDVLDPPDIKEPAQISGTAQEGETLTVSGGDWRPRDATPTYTWLRCDDEGEACASTGATGTSYLLTAEDIGQRIVVRLVVTKDGLASEPEDSEATGIVSAAPRPEPTPAPTPTPTPPPPVAPDPAGTATQVPPPPAIPAPLAVAELANLVPPAILGAPYVGNRLRTFGGQWSEPAAVTFRWLRCGANGGGCTPIPNATNARHRVTAADVGHRLVVRATATTFAGAGFADSAPTEVVSALPALIQPFPVVRFAGRFTASGTRLTVVTFTVGLGTRISVRCRGTGCFRSRFAFTSRLVRVHRLQRTYAPGAVVVVRMTQPDRIGKYVRLLIRSGRAPLRRDRCLMPGDRAPVTCPAI